MAVDAWWTTGSTATAWYDAPSSPAVARAWWQRLLGGPPAAADPPVTFVPGAARSLRDRWHLDVVRPGDVVAAVAPGPAGGPHGVRHVDPDGLEVDLVPGDPLPDGASDWTAVFSSTAHYRVDDAARLQAAARDAGGVPDPQAACFVQLVVDALDVEAVRRFWLGALGHLPDPREGLADTHDRRRLAPVLLLQPLDAGEPDRLGQRSRVHLSLTVPPEMLTTRVEAALAAGGRVVGGSDGSTTVADPEGNALAIAAG